MNEAGSPTEIEHIALAEALFMRNFGSRNFIIHQYDQINREMTWLTLSRDLVDWEASLSRQFVGAALAIEGEMN